MIKIHTTTSRRASQLSKKQQHLTISNTFLPIKALHINPKTHNHTIEIERRGEITITFVEQSLELGHDEKGGRS